MKASYSDWQEVIPFLAGKLHDPVPLLELLVDPTLDDVLRHRLLLAAHCLPELSLPGHQRLSNLLRESKHA